MKRICIILLVLLFLTGCGPKPDNGAPIPWKAEAEAGGNQILDYEDNPISDGGGWYGDLPNGLRPTVCIGGKLFRWTGMSKELHIDETGIYIIGNSETYLPDGYSPIGEITGICEEIPTEELQLRAAFEAEATFYANPDTPEVVYALMTTDWFENRYVRFVSDDLHENACVAWKGRQYRFDITDSPTLEELPEGCQQIGTLHYIGADLVPVNDLETNRAGDVHGKHLDGREVYAIPGDDTAIYVYEHHYWAGGDYPTWRVCPLW